MDFRSEAKRFFSRAYSLAIQEASPEKAIRKTVKLQDNLIGIGPDWFSCRNFDRILVVGFGKASTAMATALERVLGDRIDRGVVVTKYQHGRPLERIQAYEASHPIPDEAGVTATSAIIRLLQGARATDLVLALISGGGSALLVHPRPGITLRDKQTLTDFMLRRGVPIEKMNVVRKHLSAVKGGQLARLAFPARVYSLIISDVIGDKLEAIASGPTAPDPSSFSDAEEILREFGIWQKMSAELRNWFREQSGSEGAETPKPGDPLFHRVKNLVIANNQLSLQVVARYAAAEGYRPLILSSRVQGEAREIARFFGAIAQEIRFSGQPLKPPACVIAGGETTVTVTGSGKGGRNTEMVLAILPDLQGLGDVAFFSAGTDGTDGPTDAAGAFGFSDSLARSENLKLQARAFLTNNDSYPFFEKLDDLFCPGASGTNVIDIQILLIQ